MRFAGGWRVIGSLESDMAPDWLSSAGIVLPSQYFKAPEFCSEQRLMLAVLVDAIHVLKARTRRGGNRRRRDFVETSVWVMKKGTWDAFSFDNVCAGLGIGADMARQRIQGFIDGSKADLIGYGHPRLKQSTRSQKIGAIRGGRRTASWQSEAVIIW